MYTVEQVKQELPPVKVLLPSGKVVQGQVYGRRNRFATVNVKQDGLQITMEVAWETVTRCINADRPIHY